MPKLQKKEGQPVVNQTMAHGQRLTTGYQPASSPQLLVGAR
jgi:hypothetical protein